MEAHSSRQSAAAAGAASGATQAQGQHIGLAASQVAVLESILPPMRFQLGAAKVRADKADNAATGAAASPQAISNVRCDASLSVLPDASLALSAGMPLGGDTSAEEGAAASEGDPSAEKATSSTGPAGAEAEVEKGEQAVDNADGCGIKAKKAGRALLDASLARELLQLVEQAQAAGESFDTMATAKVWALRHLLRFCEAQDEQLVVFAER